MKLTHENLGIHNLEGIWIYIIELEGRIATYHIE